MKEVVIVSGSRTAVGTFGGSLKNVSAIDLGSVVMKDVLRKVSLRPATNENITALAPEKLQDQGMTEIETAAYDWDDTLKPVVIDEVIMGNVLQAGQGQNPARQAMIRAGYLKETPAYTINKICGSGLKAIALRVVVVLIGIGLV